MVDRFQNGETDVLICTFGVGSTGTTCTLTDSSYFSYRFLHYQIRFMVTENREYP